MELLNTILIIAHPITALTFSLLDELVDVDLSWTTCFSAPLIMFCKTVQRLLSVWLSKKRKTPFNSVSMRGQLPGSNKCGTRVLLTKAQV